MKKINKLSASDPLEEIAEQSAGNWMKFDSFVWYDKPELPEEWAIVYTSHRDSTLIDESNAVQIEKLLGPYLDPNGKDMPIDICPERHSHWAVGYVDGYSIRVFRDGRITPAFRKWCEISDRLRDYPLLNEEDYSQREHEATIENIEQAAWRYRKADWPEDWASHVYSWLENNDPSAIENRDDRGGYPGDGQLESAIHALGFPIEG